MNFYIIAHKVRGEPAFDIAIKLDTPLDEEVWIIPTSGHRAYPYWYEEFNRVPPLMPEDLRDHYSTFAEPRFAGVRKLTPAPRPATPNLEDL